MKYSFVIPTYNNKRLLENTLEALHHQEGFGKDEYQAVIVDDGSDDNTHQIIEKQNRNYNLKYIFLDRMTDSCRAKARNCGWKNADGEIIIFIDSDIIVKRNYLSQLTGCYEMESNMVVFGTRLMLQDDIETEEISNGEIFRKYKFDRSKAEYFEHRHYLFNTMSYNINCFLDPWLYAYSCNVAIPRKIINEERGFDENYKGWGVEDLELSYKIYLKGVKFVFNSNLEAFHQNHTRATNVNVKSGVYNAECFIRKYPDALKIFPHEVKKLLLIGGLEHDFTGMQEEVEYIGKKIEACLPPNTKCNKTEIIEFKNKADIDKIKAKIKKLTASSDIRIIVNDYVEDTDLGIWIQLLDKSGSVPLYFVMSKKLNAPGFPGP
ncbi:MAG: glycosyltransferase family 2 protein [Spirochaetales bacterium]|nr:glycosyltransferase family 2 protein [Spirochaetales bacterium]